MRRSLAICAVVTVALRTSAGGYEEKTLFSFERGDSGGWTGSGGASASVVREHATDGTGALKVTFPKAQSSFGRRQGPGGALDLSGWDKLKIDASNTGDPVVVTLRARDGSGRTYQCWYQRIGRGRSTLEYALRGLASKVPEKGKVTGLDLSNITAIDIRVDQNKLPTPACVYFDNVRLSRGTEPPRSSKEGRPKRRAAGRPVVDIPGNILQNPDFEMGLQGWGSWGQWDGGQYSFGTGRGEFAHTGAASAEIACEKVGRGGIFSPPLKPPATCKLTFWARGAGGAKIRVSVTKGGISRTIDVPEEWTRYEFDTQVSDGSRLYFCNVGAGSLYVDTVSLVPPGGAADADDPAVSERPSKVITKGDRTFVNGRPFFPIGIYGVRDPEKEFAGTGFNFAFGSATSGSPAEWYTLCREAGVMTVANLTGLMRGHMPEQAPAAISAVKRRSSLFGYYICDEPDHGAWNVTPPEIRAAHYLLKEADPGHPTIVLVMAWHRSMAYQYADTADIIASDPYSVSDMDKPVRSTLWMDDGLSNKQPVWVVLQAGWDKTPEPSPEAVRAQAYSAVASGADGIFWFELQYCKKHPKVWEPVKQASNELKEIHDELCGRGPEGMQPRFSDGRVIGIVKMSGAERADKTQRSTLVVTVNKTLEDAGEVEISAPGLGSKRAEVLFESRTVRFSGGKLKASFGPGERHVYRVR